MYTYQNSLYKKWEKLINELSLFAGAGGGILGGQLLGWRTVCAVENEPYAISVLLQRQNEKIFPTFPIWDDICTFDGKPWQGIVDVVSGGFPCTDISVAGKGAGIKGKESGLWSEMARVIGEVRPQYAFIENSPMLVTRGLDTVLCDLAKLGFNARWGCISAAEVGANHKRNRIWIVARNVANTDSNRSSTRLSGQNKGKKGNAKEFDHRGNRQGRRSRENWWSAMSDMRRVSHGVAARTHRLKACGNGQVPEVVRVAWEILSKGL